MCISKPPAYALVGLMLSMVAADAALDPEAVWEEMERKGVIMEWVQAGGARGRACRRCRLAQVGRLPCLPSGQPCCVRPRSAPAAAPDCKRRKPRSVIRTWSLLIAAVILYIPANFFSVMNITRLGQTGPHTILGGAKELLDAGMWPLALLVFFASITVPVLKLISLVTMLLATRRGTSWRLIDRTRLYRIVDFIGRWSMIDVFMISILVALVHFGQLANITSDIGGVAFAGVVVLTMFAAEGFDPRLMWDAAQADAKTAADREELTGEAGGNTV